MGKSGPSSREPLRTHPITSADRPVLGITLMIIGMLIVPLLDGCAKILSADYSVLQVSWARFAFHFVWLLPIVAWRGHRWWRIPSSPWLHASRSAFLLIATVFFFLAISVVPIPNALALLFVSPLIVTVAAPFILDERFAPARITAATIGLFGVLVVLRPGTTDFSPMALFALGAGFSYAMYIITTRRVAGRSPPLLTLFYTAVVGFFVLSLVMPWVWIWPDATGWGLMALMGLIAAAGHFMVIKACDYADASLLSPFNYAEIIGATAVSYWLFGYFPDTWVWTGIAIICGTGIAISLWELKPARGVPETVDL